MLIFLDEFPKTFPFVSIVFRKIVHYQAKRILYLLLIIVNSFILLAYSNCI
jgi:hypothetical protein